MFLPWVVVVMAHADAGNELWQPVDFSFKSQVTVANPFLVEFSAEVTGPDGIKFSLPGFYKRD